MEQPELTRREIHIISRYSNWPERGIKQKLKNGGIYADRSAWAKFIDMGFLALGVAFAVSGIVFFFAYNWHNLHKFVKLGLVEGLLITAVATAIFAKLQPLIKNIILTGASVLVKAEIMFATGSLFLLAWFILKKQLQYYEQN